MARTNGTPSEQNLPQVVQDALELCRAERLALQEEARLISLCEILRENLENPEVFPQGVSRRLESSLYRMVNIATRGEDVGDVRRTLRDALNTAVGLPK